MKVALIDNGSLEPGAHAALRAAACAIGDIAGIGVDAVSWRHSDRIPAGALGGRPAWTLAPWIRAQVTAGEREFTLVPFFISPQGAIGSLLRRDLEALQAEAGGFEFSFAEGLATGHTLAAFVEDRVREAAAARALIRPAVVVVDHGGPSKASAGVRDFVADGARERLRGVIGPLAAASMESPEGPEFHVSRPLLADVLGGPGFDEGDVLIAPLFLLPGRHAGPRGDLARIACAAEARSPGLRCHFTGLVGSHRIATEFLAGALSQALAAAAHP